jgi:hypothetical protein
MAFVIVGDTAVPDDVSVTDPRLVVPLENVTVPVGAAVVNPGVPVYTGLTVAEKEI